ncbi:MAG: O-acetyl-ADP-ribose deacetylase [Omnitrophica bacterium GWA2_52_8]|nr:MAG: O-acetyl-ADP-ribose deacetylase [Omnitrophica bacterium GWA2_52_8]
MQIKNKKSSSPIRIVRGDITIMEVDAVVNAANSQLKGGGGVDGAIHRAAGPGVMEECRGIGKCPTGKAVVTNAGSLKAKKIIHAVGPVWRGGNANEETLLRSAYETSFEAAVRLGLKTIAFPAIGTGVYGYPKEAAARIALAAGNKYAPHFDRIYFVCFSDPDVAVYESLLNQADG